MSKPPTATPAPAREKPARVDTNIYAAVRDGCFSRNSYDSQQGDGTAAVQAPPGVELVRQNRQGNKLILVIEGPTVESVTDHHARNFSDAKRAELGFRGGSSSDGPHYPVDSAKEASQRDRALLPHEMAALAKDPKRIRYRCQYVYMTDQIW